MAEVLGTATGILAVAEVGFSLAGTLYTYATAAKGAEKDIKKIARDVKLTSKVLKRTHEQIEADKEARSFTEEALFDLEDVLDGCREAFQEVDDALKGSMKVDAKGESKMSFTDRLKWPLKQDKLEVLRANLERLKSTLLLMLSVLAYGSKMQQQQVAKPETQGDFTLEKLQIQNLMQAKDEATRRFEELSAAFAKLEAAIHNETDKAPGVPGSSGATTVSLMVTPGPLSPDTKPTTHQSHRSEFVTARLQLCASAVSKLTSTIDLATKRWETERILKHDPITQCLQETTDSIALLKHHAQMQDQPPELPANNSNPDAQTDVVVGVDGFTKNADIVQGPRPKSNPLLRSHEVHVTREGVRYLTNSGLNWTPSSEANDALVDRLYSRDSKSHSTKECREQKLPEEFNEKHPVQDDVVPILAEDRLDKTKIQPDAEEAETDDDLDTQLAAAMDEDNDNDDNGNGSREEMHPPIANLVDSIGDADEAEEPEDSDELMQNLLHRWTRTRVE